MIKKLDFSNIETEHICCAFSDKKCKEGYEGKKKWLKDQMDDGYVFKKLDFRGKVFIEYCPAEKGWLPVNANNYMLINCFWVSGRFKGQGNAKDLLKECEKDAANMSGIIAVVANKKQAFMSDKKFYLKQGFSVCDSAPPYFELLYKAFDQKAPVPKFRDSVKNAKCDIEKGLVVYYTSACPFNEYYANVELKRVAEKRNLPLQIIKLESREQAQNHFVPHSLYSVFYNGEFVTQHILNEKNFDKHIDLY